MTLPNKLTTLRVLCTPLIFAVWYAGFYHNLFPGVGAFLLGGLFVLCELTDMLDGYFARKYNLVSDLGKLMDPFSDVILRITYFFCFTLSGLMPPWVFAIILWRELSMMFIRTLLVKEGTALAANLGGKIKALLYFFSGVGGITILILKALLPKTEWMKMAENILEWVFILAMLASLSSFISYFQAYLERKHSEN